MTTEDIANAPSVKAKDLKQCPVEYERHSSHFREEFVEKTHELHANCPIAWTAAYGGHWVASHIDEVLAVARRSDAVTNFRDHTGTKNGYQGISIPPFPRNGPASPGFLELDPPEQTDFRRILNPYLSPAAVARWIGVIDEITRACLDERIESGSIDFVYDLANVVPAVTTMGLLGFPLADWVVHNDAAHKQIYTPPSSPQYSAVMKMVDDSREAMAKSIRDVRAHPRPGLINALINGTVDGKELSDVEITGTCGLLVGGGFDTTTALTGQALLWLSIHPDRRKELTDDLEHLLDPATEEFLRFFTPAQGDARTFSQDVEIDGIEFKEGERLWLSWAMANRSPGVFTTPDEVDLHRRGNRHASFGLGIHRCIGSNLARTMFKRMITAVLERMPDFTCDPNAVVHYESVAVINGLVSLPATFTPGTRRGAGLAETLAHVETIIAKEQLAEPVARRHHQ